MRERQERSASAAAHADGSGDEGDLEMGGGGGDGGGSSAADNTAPNSARSESGGPGHSHDGGGHGHGHSHGSPKHAHVSHRANTKAAAFFQPHSATKPEALLKSPALAVYVPFFYEGGYDDFDVVCTMEEDDWDDMLEEVSALAYAGGVPMKTGHKRQIISLIRNQKVRRQNHIATSSDEEEAPADEAMSSSSSSSEQDARLSPRQRRRRQRRKEREREKRRRMPGGGNGQHTKRSVVTVRGKRERRRPREEETTDRAVAEKSAQRMTCLSGFVCVNVHYMYCAGLTIFFLALSFFLLWLYKDVSSGNTQDTEESGGWKFVKGLYITGFVFSGVTTLLCCFNYSNNPSGGPAPLPDYDGMFPSCQDGTCACNCPDACGDPNEGGGCDELCRSCSDNCSLPECDCKCPDCKLDLGCCPSCDNAGECFSKVWKIVTCQCEIQV